MAYDKVIDSTKLDADITTIADAIREKSGTSGKMTFPSGMADAVRNIQTGVELPELNELAEPEEVFLGKDYIDSDGQKKTGKFTIDDELMVQDSLISQIRDALNGKAGSGSIKPEQEKMVNIIKNGTVEIIPDDGYSMSKVTVTVNVPSEGDTNNDFIPMIERSQSSIVIPNGCTTIGDYAFYSHSALTSVQIPDTVTNIGNSSFYQCSKLAEVNLPVNLNILGTRAFYNCRGLTSITFRNTPTSIANNSFGACTNLKTINVPWASGAVANAPWGATNATINYNYKG